MLVNLNKREGIKMSKIVVHCCGGAGINIGDKVVSNLMDLGDGFSEIDISYIDTSYSNIDKIDAKGEFWLVKTKTSSGGTINGSGSERSTHATDIMANIAEYIDHKKYTARKDKEYHCVIFSASGGSGSVAGPLLLKSLMEKNIPVFIVVVGDSSNGLSAKNTNRTMLSLDAIANQAGKAINVVYVNNHGLVGDVGIVSAEKEANKILFNTLCGVSLFLSSDNEYLDYQDMVLFIDPSGYKSIRVEPGLCGINVFSKEIVIPEGSVPTISRTLTAGDLPCDVGITFFHSKKGNVVNKNVLDTLDGQFPIHLVSFSNYFSTENKTLNKVIEDYNTIMDNVKAAPLRGAKEDKVDKDTGLIF